MDRRRHICRERSKSPLSRNLGGPTARLESSLDFPMPKTFGEAIETSRNKKHCASKLHLRRLLRSPPAHTRQSKNGVSAPQGLPELCRANAAADSFAPGQTSGATWCAEAFPKVNPASAKSSLAANLLEPLLHVHEIRVFVDLLLRVPKLLLELGLVVLDVLAKLFDLLRVALLPRGLLLRLLLAHVTLERSLLLLERVQLRNPVDDVRVLVDLAARHPLSLELRLLGHDVLLQLLHLFELLLAETLRRLLLLLLRRKDQLRRHRCHVVLARISAGEQVVVLAPLRLRVLGCLVARGNRLLPHKNTLRIHEVRILLQFSNLPGLRVAGLLVLLPSQGVHLTLQHFHLRHGLSDDGLRGRGIHAYGCVVSVERGKELEP